MSILHFRRYVRVEVEMPIRIIFREAKEPIAAYISNLSEEGASLIYSTPIHITSSMELEISLPQVEPPVLVRADVLWVRPMIDDGQHVFAHGLLFNRIGYEDRQRLKTFISQNSSY